MTPRLARPAYFVGWACGPTLHDGTRAWFQPRQMWPEYAQRFVSEFPAGDRTVLGWDQGRPVGTTFGYWLSDDADDVARFRAVLPRLPDWSDRSGVVDSFRDVAGWRADMNADEELAWLWRQQVLSQNPVSASALDGPDTQSLRLQGTLAARLFGPLACRRRPGLPW